jgi:hypothetical protein
VILQWLPPTGESALYRSTHPRSWWWTPEIDFHARELHALEGANWQRAKSKKNAPKLITRPKEVKKRRGLTAEEQRARKQKFKEKRGGASSPQN